MRRLIAMTVLLAVSGGLCRADQIPLGKSMRQLLETDWIARDARFTASHLTKPQRSPHSGSKVNANGVSTVQDAGGACDGIKNGRWGFHTASGEQDPWWQVDLQAQYKLDRIVVFNRTDGGAAPRTRNLQVLVAGNTGEFERIYQHDGSVFYGVKEDKPLVIHLDGIPARIVGLCVPGRCSFALDEVEVYATDGPQKNIALGKPADQKSVGPYSYPGTLPDDVNSAVPPKVAPNPTFSLAQSREETVQPTLD